jgi:soluble lytic murein transglycosylase-like protein
VKLLSTVLLILLSVPTFAQLYSYRNEEGRLIITDKPIFEEGYKLDKTQLPKHMEKAKKEQFEKKVRSKNKEKVWRLSKEQVKGLVKPIAKAMSVDPNLVYAVIEIESARDVNATSNKNAQGLMQLIPATAKRFGVKNSYDPRQNIRGGISYLRYLLSYFAGDVDLVLAAYNAGENGVDRHNGIPPYKETRRYVKKIRKLYTAKTHPFDDTAPRKSKLAKLQMDQSFEPKSVRSAE